MCCSSCRLGLSILLVAAAGAARAEEVTTVEQPPTMPASTLYVTNRAPLSASALVRLPPGAVRPQDWLLKMLRMQADGFHGRLLELSPYLRKEGNAWLS